VKTKQKLAYFNRFFKHNRSIVTIPTHKQNNRLYKKYGLLPPHGISGYKTQPPREMFHVLQKNFLCEIVRFLTGIFLPEFACRFPLEAKRRRMIRSQAAAFHLLFVLPILPVKHFSYILHPQPRA
jgi:hypothetical protein